MRIAVATLFCTFLVFGISACGKKPKEVKSPAYVANKKLVASLTKFNQLLKSTMDGTTAVDPVIEEMKTVEKEILQLGEKAKELEKDLTTKEKGDLAFGPHLLFVLQTKATTKLCGELAKKRKKNAKVLEALGTMSMFEVLAEKRIFRYEVD